MEVILAKEFPRPDAKDRVSALNEDKFLVQFSATQEFIENLEKAKAMLCRKFPKAKACEVLGEALKVLLEETETEKTALVDSPIQENTPRYIPRGIRNEVWKRDNGCCQFKTPGGQICGEKRFLEYDHVLPWALGGSSHSARNIRLLCRAHNQWNARLAFRNWPASATRS